MVSFDVGFMGMGLDHNLELKRCLCTFSPRAKEDLKNRNRLPWFFWRGGKGVDLSGSISKSKIFKQ